MALFWVFLPTAMAACSHVELPGVVSAHHLPETASEDMITFKEDSHASETSQSHSSHSHEPSQQEGHCQPGEDHCDPDMLGGLEGLLLKKTDFLKNQPPLITLQHNQATDSIVYSVSPRNIAPKTGPPDSIFPSTLFHHHILLLI